MRRLSATGRFGSAAHGGVVRNAAIALVTAGMLTGAVGFANADDPAAPPTAAPSTEPAAPTAAPPAQPAPAATVPAAEPAPAAPVSPAPAEPPVQPAPVTTVPPVPVTTAPPTPPVPVTTVPAAEPVPAAPISPVAPEPASAAPQAPAPATTVFTLTTMPNGWMSNPDLRPALEVQSDGRAVKRQDGRELNGSIAADVLAAAAGEARALALADMGEPKLTDQGSMIIDFMPQAPDQDVHVIVYAPEFSEGLTDDQKASRKRFDDLYQRLLNAFVAS